MLKIVQKFVSKKNVWPILLFDMLWVRNLSHHNEVGSERINIQIAQERDQDLDLTL